MRCEGRAGERGFGGTVEADVGCAHAAPAGVDGKEELGSVGEEGCLGLRVEHEVAAALRLVGEGGEDAAADTEVGRAHMGGLFGSGKGEGEAAEVR